MNVENEFWGAEAKKKAAELRKIGQDESKWEVYYEDDHSGERWVLDYPDSESQGGGSPRLRKITPD
jgi:hypothetical protein